MEMINWIAFYIAFYKREIKTHLVAIMEKILIFASLEKWFSW